MMRSKKKKITFHLKIFYLLLPSLFSKLQVILHSLNDFEPIFPLHCVFFILYSLCPLKMNLESWNTTKLVMIKKPHKINININITAKSHEHFHPMGWNDCILPLELSKFYLCFISFNLGKNYFYGDIYVQ